MVDSWYYLDSGPCVPAHNMAVDEALLHHAAQIGRPVLRSYGWGESAATFGYFQRYPEVARATSLRPLLRRPTGGGLVPHVGDWTYSVVIPPGHSWHSLRATASYEKVHLWLRNAWSGLGVTTHLAPCGHAAGPGHCFVGWEKSDLLRGDTKLAGAAQRRNRDGLLIQGSLQPVPEGRDRAEFFAALRAVATREWAVKWEVLGPGAWCQSAETLVKRSTRGRNTTCADDSRTTSCRICDTKLSERPGGSDVRTVPWCPVIWKSPGDHFGIRTARAVTPVPAKWKRSG